MNVFPQPLLSLRYSWERLRPIAPGLSSMFVLGTWVSHHFSQTCQHRQETIQFHVINDFFNTTWRQSEENQAGLDEGRKKERKAIKLQVIPENLRSAYPSHHYANDKTVTDLFSNKVIVILVATTTKTVTPWKKSYARTLDTWKKYMTSLAGSVHTKLYVIIWMNVILDHIAGRAPENWCLMCAREDSYETWIKRVWGQLDPAKSSSILTKDWCRSRSNMPFDTWSMELTLERSLLVSQCGEPCPRIRPTMREGSWQDFEGVARLQVSALWACTSTSTCRFALLSNSLTFSESQFPGFSSYLRRVFLTQKPLMFCTHQQTPTATCECFEASDLRVQLNNQNVEFEESKSF